MGVEIITTIEPKSGWQLINFKELLEYKDLFFFLVWRDIKVLYAQTILGFSWAIFQPLVQIILFTIVFGKVAKISTDGIPYFLFSTVAIIPWTFMSQAMTQSSQSLVTGQHILGKVYFPRLIFPLTAVFAKMVDFGISLFIILFALIYYKVLPTWNLLLLPLFILNMLCIAAGVGLWLSAMAIRFRDVRYALSFLTRILMYTAPIVYSASSIPAKWRMVYSLNPIVGTIEGFRACLLGTPIPWGYIWPGIITAAMLLVSGSLYFKHMEKVFVDVI
ncbi:MAG: ABC transporter permease [Desulfosarcina sp.]|nr:ABC transporter permease [Desulfosarcina sp.]